MVNDEPEPEPAAVGAVIAIAGGRSAIVRGLYYWHDDAIVLEDPAAVSRLCREHLRIEPDTLVGVLAEGAGQLLPAACGSDTLLAVETFRIAGGVVEFSVEMSLSVEPLASA